MTHADPPDDLSDDERDEYWDDRNDLADGAYFTCGRHQYGDIDADALPAEHPTWIDHVLTDDSWSAWREGNHAEVARMSEGRA